MEKNDNTINNKNNNIDFKTTMATTSTTTTTTMITTISNKNKKKKNETFDKHKALKSSSSNDRLRWNLLFNLLIWSLIPLPLWLPFASPVVAFYLLPSLQIIFSVSWFVVNVSSWRTYWTLRRWKQNNDVKEKMKTESETATTISTEQRCNNDLSNHIKQPHHYTQTAHTVVSLHHLVVISAYKEPLSLLFETISTLATQRTNFTSSLSSSSPSSTSSSSPSAKKVPLTLTISFEERTPEVYDKIRYLHQEFGNSFRRLIFTIHPFGVAGEIPGKCSNANYGIRESLRYLELEGIGGGIKEEEKDEENKGVDNESYEKDDDVLEKADNIDNDRDKSKPMDGISKTVNLKIPIDDIKDGRDSSNPVVGITEAEELNLKIPNDDVQKFSVQSSNVVTDDEGTSKDVNNNIDDDINPTAASDPHIIKTTTTETTLTSNAGNIPDILITTCDADTKFHPSFLHELTKSFLSQSIDRRYDAIFQSPLLYNWRLDEANVVTRVTGIVRASLMMGALIPFNINSMSVFSFSSRLAIAGDYIHPAYQMDDIIALIRWMGVARQRLRLVLLPIPTLSGPTSGRVLEEELTEWAIQARRWTIGAAEVFHYFVVKAGRMPLQAAIAWGAAFMFYYGILLCCSHLYGLAYSVSYAIFNSMAIRGYRGSPMTSRIFVIINLFGLYLNSLLMFLLDWKAPKLLQPKPKERISFLRNCYHFVVSPLVIAAYSLVEFIALNELAVRGKQVCSHRPSKKVDLM